MTTSSKLPRSVIDINIINLPAKLLITDSPNDWTKLPSPRATIKAGAKSNDSPVNSLHGAH